MSQRRSMVAAVAVLLALSALAVPGYAKKKAKPAPVPARMDERQRAEHALSRLTFGPRPGEVDRVMALGVDRWIDLQLHPEKIDDHVLEARLLPYHTLQMTAPQMVEAFPTPQVIKQVAEGKMAMPDDPQLRAVYQAGVARLNQKQAKKNQAAEQNATLLETNADTLTPEMKEKRQTVRDHERARVLDLMEMPAAKRTQTIAAMDDDERRAFWRAISQDDRDRLVADMTPEQKELLLALENPVAVVNGELMEAKLLRATGSERQLLEVMTDFWFNHFNVYLDKGADHYLVTSYERDVIRPHALGKFKDLLMATAKSPAMLWYLDNWESVGPNSAAAQRGRNGKAPQGLNENYAREVMELHTLGVNGGYTQKDVTELARVLTGWTIEEPRLGGGFIFRQARHEPGDKTVLGKVFHEDGMHEGETALAMLASEPATAHFISTKIAQRFVSDTPPPALVDAMARTFLASDGDIREVLRTMLRAPEFWQVTEYRAKVKTPLEFTVSALRASGAEITRPRAVNEALNRMGMPLYRSLPPTGYSMQAASWMNSSELLNRINFALALGANKLAGVSVDTARIAGGSNLAPEAAQHALEQTLLDGNVSAQTHETIARQWSNSPANAQQKPGQPPPPADAGVLAGMILGSPEFERR